jgi:hypothetical protein
MALTNAYCTLVELKAWIGISDSVDDANLELTINAASRWIEQKCGRRFWIDPAVVARTFVADDLYLLNIDELATTTGLIVKVDRNYDGTFETTLTAGTDFIVLPDDASTAFPEAQPFTQLQMIGSSTWPYRWWPNHREALVQITGKWGWPAVPDDVKLACVMRSFQLFTRRKSPEGVAGFNDFGVVRVVPRDADILELLENYRRDKHVIV